jgi:dTDP-glucose 4,6-dehydratase
MSKCYLVTGGLGFIGSQYIRLILDQEPDIQVHNLDAQTYAGNPENLAGYDDRTQYHYHKVDIRDKDAVSQTVENIAPDAIIHFAAESHVDRSIEAPLLFVETNVMGTLHLLEAARAVHSKTPNFRFLHVSTDEVYGSLGPSGAFKETTSYDPSSPYSASKASSDHFVRAWGRTFGLPVLITNCSNNYGPFQFPEKLIPLMINNALHGKPLPVYGDGKNVRDWLYVEDHARAIDLVLRTASLGETYNIGGEAEMQNLTVVHTLCDLVDELKGPLAEGRSRRDLIHFVTDRPGHDRRYAMDITKISTELGWRPRYSFEDGLRKTVQWYLENDRWLAHVIDGSYKTYYSRMYDDR